MRVKIHYPAFLRGFPSRHRTVKQCLLALPLDVEIQEVEREHAPVAITYSDHANRIVEFREFGGLLYRSLGIGAGQLATHMDSRRIFDAKGEVLGVMASRAMRDYHKVGKEMNVLPRKVVEHANQMVVDDCDKDKAFDLGEAFVVSDDDMDRARSYEDMAMERMEGFISIDGVMSYRSVEPVYCATPKTDQGPGKVNIVNRGYAFLTDDPFYVNRYPIWSQADVSFFSALSGEEAAAHAGLSVNDVPSISVFDASVVRLDFEAMGVERMAHNIVSVIGSDEINLPLQSLGQSIRIALKNRIPTEQHYDVLAGLILEVASLSRNDKTMTAAKVLRRFTPEIMENAVERWNGRPVQIKPIGGPKAK
jgi:hypothetical protein